MYKCLKILLGGTVSVDFLRSIVQKHAKKLALEGTAQLLPENARACLIVCGQKNSLDEFLDVLHTQLPHLGVNHLEIEPFLKTKDYRGVFRVIE